MNPAQRNREEVLNVILAHCLERRGIPASPETILQAQSRHMPDVIFTYQGLRCIIEGKLGDVANARTQVETDARGRVDIGIAHLAVAVVYPGFLREYPFAEMLAMLNTLRLEFIIYTENGPGSWQTGTLDDLLSALKLAHEALIRDDIVTQAVEILSYGMGTFSLHLQSSPATCQRLMPVLGISEPEQKVPIETVYATTANITALTIINALIFQQMLSWTDKRVRPIHEFLTEKMVQSALIEHWRYICETINYVPVFSLVQEALEKIPYHFGNDDVLRNLINNCMEIIGKRAALRHDLMGRLYHRLLLEAKFLGTFYTSIPAATLLTKLALAPVGWNVEWSRFDKLKDFRVADIACGTGTLLMAVSQAVSDNYVRTAAESGQSLSQENMRDLHRVLMEDVIHGYDVLASAVHLTASSLALLAPEVAFKKMQLYILPLGKTVNGNISLGSIDYLKGETIKVQLQLFEPPADEPKQVNGKGDVISTALLPDLDLAIMNPPFVRSVGGNLLFGSVRGREELQEELARVLHANGQAIEASSTAGLGAVFVATADPYIKPGGRLALVLPAAITTGIAWEKTRELLSRNYLLEYLVLSHDPERWNFSENTDLSEILIVARKKVAGENDQDSKSVFINLWRNPRSAAHALAVANEALSGSPASLGSAEAPDHGIESIMVGGEKYAEIIAFPSRDLKTGPWIGGAFAQTALTRAAWFLGQGKLILPGAGEANDLPVCKLSELGSLGPDCRDIHDGFIKRTTRSPYPALWSHKAEKTRTVSLSINAYLEPRTKAAAGRPRRKTSALWPKAGRLMVAERIWFITQSVLCARLPVKALSNVWWPLILKKENELAEKALVLWFNSTLGILSMAFHRVPTRGSWVKFKKPLLHDLPVLDVNHLGKRKLNRLAKVYDEVCDLELLPFPRLAEDPVRQRIDEAMAEALDLPSLRGLAGLLAIEPVICGRGLGSPSQDPENEEKDAPADPEVDSE